jgi:hypothetical protein
MAIEIITAQEKLRDVPRQWRKQYEGKPVTKWNNHPEMTAKLMALKWPFTKDQVDSIIGNTTWTELKCDLCDSNVSAISRLSLSYAAKHCIDVCLDCLNKAVIRLKRES